MERDIGKRKGGERGKRKEEGREGEERAILKGKTAIGGRGRRNGTTEGKQKWVKGKGSPYSITERRVPEMIPVFGGQPAGDLNHKPGGTLPLLSTRPAVTPTTLNKRAAANLLLGEQRHNGCEQFA